MPENQSTTNKLWDWLGGSEVLQGLGDLNPLSMILLTLMGHIINQKQSEDVISPKSAHNLMSTRLTGMENRLNQAQSGQTQNPAVANMRNMLQQRAEQQFNPSQMLPGYFAANPGTGQAQLNPPQRFDPYQNNPQYGQIDPLLLMKMRDMAIGGQSPLQQWGTNILSESMRNRFSPRGMRQGMMPGNLNLIPGVGG